MAKKITLPTPEEKAPILIAVTKDGQEINIHPDQIEQHQRLGWHVKE